MRRFGLLLGAVLLHGFGISAAANAQSFAQTLEEARTAYSERDFGRARTLAAAAFAIAADKLSPDDVRIFDLEAILAGSADWFSDVNAEEHHLDRLIDFTTANMGGADGINSAFVKEALAHVYIRTGRIDEADQIFREIAQTRKIMVVGGVDPFQARHLANAASIALARKKWEDAFDGFHDAIRLIDFSKLKRTNEEDIADLSSETNAWTFVGLSRAAWELSQLDPATDYADQAFQAMQWKWKLSASSALLRASARAYADDPALNAKQRTISDLGQQIAAINEQLEKLHESTPGLTDEQLGAYLEVDQDALIKAMQQSTELGQKMLKLLQTCPNECAAEIADLQHQKDEIDAHSMELVAPVTQMEAGRQDQPKDDHFEQERQRLYEERNRLQNELEKAKAELDAIQPQKVEGRGNLGFLAEPNPIAITDVQQLLGNDDALVSFLIGKDQSFVWAVSSDGFAWSPIAQGERSLSQRVGALLAGIRSSGASRGAAPLAPTSVEKNSFDLTVAYSLYADLFGPVENLVSARHHLFLVPSGPLSALPFQALIAGAPNPSLNDPEAIRKADWLIRHHAITVLPSIVSLKAIRQFTRSGRAKNPFIGFGDPLFDTQEVGTTGDTDRGLSSYFNGSMADPSALRKLPSLPDTADELRTVAEVLGATQEDIVLGRDATERNVRTRELDNYRVVHFATHGLVGGEILGAAEPALVLTPPLEATFEDDGLLTASEIAQLRLNADWVVLSACNTAAGEAVGAEAFSGLARAFFYAGARSLLVSYWPVYSTAATSLTTTAFSEIEANSGIGRAEALRRAMVKIIQDGSTQQIQPAYWAPFTVMGDGGT
jgi:CHAT domain-containing protein